MTQNILSQQDAKSIIGRNLRKGECLIPLRDLVTTIHCELQEEDTSGFFILENCYSTDYRKSSMLSKDKSKFFEYMHMGNSKRIPLSDDICMIRRNSNFACGDGLNVAYIENASETLVSRPLPNYADRNEDDNEWDEALNSLRGVRPALFTYEDVFVFKNVRTDFIITRFLVRALNSNEVQCQWESKNHRTSEDISHSFESDFLSLMIPVPSMEEQTALLSIDDKLISGKFNVDDIIYRYATRRMKSVSNKTDKSDSSVYDFINFYDEGLGAVALYLYKNNGGKDDEVISNLPAYEEAFYGFELDFLEKEQSSVIDTCIRKIGVFNSNVHGVNLCPTELGEFMLNLLVEDRTVSSDDSIFWPFVGNKSLMLQDNSHNNYHFIGELYNRLYWAIFQVWLFFNPIKNEFLLGDIYAGDKTKYSYILGMPPVGIDKESVETVVSKLYDRLNDQGRMVLCVPSSFLLVEDNVDNIQNSLLYNRTISKIILLPDGLLDANTALCLLVVEKKEHEKVWMCDYSFAGTYSTGTSRILFDYNKILNYIEHYESGECPDDKDGYFCYDELILCNQGKRTLNPAIYLTENYLKYEMDDVMFSRLSDLVEEIKGEEAHFPIRVIQSRMHDACFDINKDFRELPVSAVKDIKGHCQLLTEDALLISVSESKLQAVYYKYNPAYPIAFNSESINAYRLKDNQVGLEYLATVLNCSDYIDRQLKARGYGSLANGRRFIDHLNLLIGVCDREKQEQEMTDLRTSVMNDWIGQEGTNYLERCQKMHEDYVLRIRSRKHAIGNVLGSVSPAINGLIKCFDKHNGSVDYDTAVWTGNDTTVKSLLGNLKKDLDRIALMVKSLTTDIDIEYGIPEPNSVCQMITQYISRHTSCGFELLHKDNHSSFVEHGFPSDVFINICKEDFFKVLDNIVSNAKRHGFVNESVHYFIVFDETMTMLDGKPAVAISVKNNGAPLAKGMTPPRVFEYGQTSSYGDGIGGWLIKDAVEHFHGKVFLNSYDLSECLYAIEYKMIFPICEPNN